jgi:hypothetical protein
LVGTKKGAFILTSDGKREQWEASAGPHFAGWEIYHLKGSPAAGPPLRVADQRLVWPDDPALRRWRKTWEPVGNEFKYDGVPGTHKWYDGTQHPWEFKRIWHLEPSPDRSGHRLCRARRTPPCSRPWTAAARGRSFPGCAAPRAISGSRARAAWGCTPSFSIRTDPERIFVAISAAGVFRTDDGGADVAAGKPRIEVPYEMPDPDAEVGHCVHRIAMHPSRPDVLFMQKHWDVMRSDNAGDSWREVSGNLPSDFGFPIDVHAHEPETIYVVPIKSDSEHFPPEGKLRVYRSRTGGNEWEALTNGLPQKDCYVNVLRDAMAVDSLEPCGVYFGTTGGQVYASADSGDTWNPIVRDLPAVLSVEVQTLP